MATAPSRVMSPDSTVPRPGSSPVRFFLLTYAATWACWIPVVMAPATALRPLLVLLWLLGVFAPSLVALALTSRNEGSAGVRALLGRVFQWRVAARWYLFAIGYMAAIKIAVAAAHRIATGAWPGFGLVWPVVMLVAI